MTEYKCGLALVKIWQGDITELSVEAIVNAANNQLWMGSGVAGAIKRKGGQEIEDEAVAKGPIEVGEAVATGAGRLAAKYVLHAAGMGQDLRTSAEIVRKTTKSCLRLADEYKIQSLAFPAIGTGVGGLSLGNCAEVMLEVVKEHLAEGEKVLKEVIFALFDEHSFHIFEETAERIFK